MLRISLIVCVFFVAVVSNASGQGVDDPKLLKKEIELLKKENELLKKENELLKAKAPDNEKQAKKPVGEEFLVEGKVLSGTWRNSTSKTTSDGKITLTISERDKTTFKGSVVLSFIDGGKADQNYDVTGNINGNRMTLKTIGSAANINMKLSIGKEEVKGTYTNAIGTNGTVAFSLSK